MYTLVLRNYNLNPNRDLGPAELKVDTPVTPALRNVQAILFTALFCFRVSSPHGTVARARPVLRPIRNSGQPHNNGARVIIM